MKPRVTVITPTLANRHGKLQAACKSIQNQTFREWTHLIVPNGYDGQMDQILRSIGHFNNKVQVTPLGRPHPTPGHWNRLLGGLLAQTPYIAYLDDDNLWRSNHLEILVDLLDSNPGIGFAYSQLKCGDRVLGDGKISPGNTVTNIDVSQVVHRAELLIEVATWDPHRAVGDPYALDGLLIDYWLCKNVGFAFVPEITVDYWGAGYWVDGGGVKATA